MLTGRRLSRTEALAHHLSRPVDAAARARARLHLVDWLGCVAGAGTGEAAARLARSPRPATARAALLGNVLEMDDVHRAALLHPGPVIWPAALEGARTMDEALAAAVRGYEAMIAVGATFDARHYAHYHPTATAGIVGAAACAAGAAAADPSVVAHAMALAASVSGGVWQTRHSDNLAKQWHVAHAVAAGRAAAAAALDGITGPLDVLEGDQGLYAATCDRPAPLVLADEWRMAEVSFKPWAACRHAHPAIDAALELRARGALELAGAAAVRVETYRDALAFCDRPAPRTPLEAKFSLQHAVAVVVRFGEPALDHFEPAAIAALADERARVTVAESPDLTARYPAHFGARVATADGAVELADARGDPERPLAREGVVAKARALMAWGGRSDAQAERGIASTLAGDDVAALVDWLGELA